MTNTTIDCQHLYIKYTGQPLVRRRAYNFASLERLFRLLGSLTAQEVEYIIMAPFENRTQYVIVDRSCTKYVDQLSGKYLLDYISQTYSS